MKVEVSKSEDILDRETKIIDWKKMRMIGFWGGEKLHPPLFWLVNTPLKMPALLWLVAQKNTALWLVIAGRAVGALHLAAGEASWQAGTRGARSFSLMSGTQTSLPPLHTAVTQNYCVCGKFQFYALVCRKEAQKLDTRTRLASSVGLQLIIKRE